MSAMWAPLEALLVAEINQVLDMLRPAIKSFLGQAHIAFLTR